MTPPSQPSLNSSGLTCNAQVLHQMPAMCVGNCFPDGPKTADYQMEHGATRNYEIWNDKRNQEDEVTRLLLARALPPSLTCVCVNRAFPGGAGACAGQNCSRS